jgi:hypothetical protein
MNNTIQMNQRRSPKGALSPGYSTVITAFMSWPGMSQR